MLIPRLKGVVRAGSVKTLKHHFKYLTGSWFLKKKVTFPDNKVNLLSLQKNNKINKKYKKLKLLGSGDIKTKFDFEVNFISKSAKEKIEKLGGKVTLIK